MTRATSSGRRASRTSSPPSSAPEPSSSWSRRARPTDAVIEELTPLLDEDDIVIDAGNAHFEDTLRREQALSDKGIHFVGMGVSGGEVGALEGPSIMVGGSDHAYERIAPVVESIAAQVDGVACAAHLGADAAGHFVKMVHNGIEYADMQLIAESFDLLRGELGLEPSEIAEVFRDWNDGDLESFLIEMTADVLTHTDAATGKPFVDVVGDAAEQKGTGRWTVQSALDLGVPVTGIAEATFARSLSGHTEQRAAVRDVFGGIAVDAGSATELDRDQFVDDVRAALYASKIVAYAQGFDQLAAGAKEHGWDLDLGTVATIWRGGCIIRARFLDRIREAYAADPDLDSLLTAPYFADALQEGIDGLAPRRRDGRGLGRADAGLLVLARLLRRPAPGPAARLAHPGAARQLRRPHLHADRP